MPKLDINLMPMKASKLPMASFDEKTHSWVIRTDYPDLNSLAGTMFIFKSDGSVDRVTTDAGGFIIEEIKVR